MSLWEQQLHAGGGIIVEIKTGGIKKMINDPDKKVEALKAKREAVYQSTQHPEHFDNEGSEYMNIDTEENNDFSTNANYDKAHGIKKNKKNKVKQPEDKKPVAENNILRSADSPDAGEDSGIPGTGMKDDIGTAASEAGLGGNKGKGTSDFPDTRNE